MSSSVFFKFKSQKEPTRVAFDGTGISVFELKRAIIDLNRLGDGTDFDLAIYNEDTNEEYDDDSTVIPRSTSVVARRLPPAKPGRGSAARYVSGKMPVNSLNHSRVERTASKPAVPAKAPDKVSGASEMAKAQSEEEKIEAMFKAGAEQWDRQQMEMANATRVYTNAAGKGKAAHVPAHPPPSGYVCYRCGEKGHWIQQCPTNNDPNFDGRPRVKRTTGIPKSFLRAVEKPAMAGDESDVNNQPPQGVRLNAAGEFVIVEPDKASWEQYQVKTKAGTGGTDEPAPRDKDIQERGLECDLDHKMFIDPNKTPCCGRTYCSECVTNYLIENDLRCPGCQKDGVLIDDLVPDHETAAKIKAYLAEKQEQKKKKADATKGDDEKSKEEGESKREAGNDAKATAKPQSPPSSEAAARSGSRSPKGASTPKSVSGSTGAPSENGVSRKRPAEDDTQDQRLPQAPRLNGGKRSPPSRPGAQPSQAGQTSQPSGPTQNAATSALPPNMLPGTPPQLFNPALGPMPFPGLGPNGYIGPPMSMAPSVTMDPSMMNPFAGMNGFGGMMNGFPNQNFIDFAVPSNGMGPYGNGHNAGGMMPGNGYGNYGSNMPMFVDNHPGDGGQPMGFGVMNGNMSGSANGMFPGPGMPNGFQIQPGPSYGGPPPDDDADAYFRKPVNPHRHQARQRRIRPSDYREL